MADPGPSLYGIHSTNSDRSGTDLWGKNQFNSTFPLALCLKMRDDGIRPVYVHVDDSGKIVARDDQISMADVVERKNEGYYSFESQYPPYEKYTLGKESIDVVVFKSTLESTTASASLTPVRPLEVKLTVVPDSVTSKRAQNEWAPELVVRPISSAYAMLGIASSLLSGENDRLLKEVTEVLRPCCQKMQRNDWTNVNSVLQNSQHLIEALHNVTIIVKPLQSPFLVHPIWRTEGQSLIFSDQCLDVFVWSNLAVVRIPLEQVSHQTNTRMTRHLREIVRHVNALDTLCTRGSFNYTDTYGGMDLSYQTDKSFSISGRVTRKFLEHPRLQRPHYSTDVIPKIILNRGETMLKPERRLDAALATQFALNQSLERMRLGEAVNKK